VTPDRHDEALQTLRASPSATAICSDFDGTLSLIVDDPSAARPVDGAVDALASLADRYAVVAVLSGRPVSFLQGWLPPPIELRGLYGLEIASDGVRRDHPQAGAWREAIDDVVAASRAAVPDGVIVEHKGLSMTLHYRTHEDLQNEVLAFAERQAARAGLALRPARMSVELHPPVAVDKGTALRELANGMSAACFIGDDAGDLPAFTALDELAAEGVAGVRVAVRSSESPAELLERADLVVDGPPGVVSFLRAL
jgi:trehalose 6-phosphate phosphatase